ncbi:hypothetical protein DPEC_G00326900 [Dallia pectoralis]|uniref:Uncharacterized protein n=1 Tax=Dallia pectoralis TaxID=75939 RepID=A0ACC2F820_DALPE|nr:hypothetical protein DPEC_G00326900 [Dallia pectoralis]
MSRILSVAVENVTFGARAWPGAFRDGLNFRLAYKPMVEMFDSGWLFIMRQYPKMSPILIWHSGHPGPFEWHRFQTADELLSFYFSKRQKRPQWNERDGWPDSEARLPSRPGRTRIASHNAPASLRGNCHPFITFGRDLTDQASSVQLGLA